MKRIQELKLDGIKMEHSSATFRKRTVIVPAGKAIVSDIAFQSHVINIHPKADPREPREEESKTEEVAKPWYVCC